MPRKKPDGTIIGFDIGSNSIKMVKAMEKEGRLNVLDFACRRYSSSEGTLNLVSQNIKELLLAAADTKKARIYSVISSRKLCVRAVRLPVMPAEEIHQVIKSEIRKYVSPDIEQVKFSFSVLGETQEKDTRKLEVVFAAVQKAIFDGYLQCFKLAGIEPAVITSACFSGWNLVREAGLDKTANSFMLIDIENEETNLTAYRGGRFVFTRNVSTAEKDLMSDVLFKEIELTAHHYYQITHGEKIDKCIISGEGSAIGGLVDFLRQKLEMSVEGLSMPQAKFQFPVDKGEEFKRSFPLYTQALGALLVRPTDINLISQRETPVKRAGLKLLEFSKMTALAVIFFVFLGAAIFAFLKGVNLYYRAKISSYKTKQEGLQGQTMQLMQMKRNTDIFEFERDLYSRLLKERPAYSVIIAEICKAIPKEKIVLDELLFFSEHKDKRSGKGSPALKFTIVGRLLGRETTAASTTKFVLALEESGFFNNISVTIKEGALPLDRGLPRGPKDRLAKAKSSEEETRVLSFAISGTVKWKN